MGGTCNPAADPAADRSADVRVLPARRVRPLRVLRRPAYLRWVLVLRQCTERRDRPTLPGKVRVRIRVVEWHGQHAHAAANATPDHPAHPAAHHAATHHAATHRPVTGLHLHGVVWGLRASRRPRVGQQRRDGTLHFALGVPTALRRASGLPLIPAHQSPQRQRLLRALHGLGAP